MDILRPQLFWIGKRCYRLNNTMDTTEQQNQKPATTNEYIEDDLYAENEDDADDVDVQDEYEVVEIAPNRYKTTFHVPQAFFGAIIGAKGAVKKRIEGETRTEITIPKHGNDDIKIMATKRDAACAARRRIELIVSNCRRKQPPTHFTCVRIYDDDIKKKFIKFKEEILQSGPTHGLEEKMFTEPSKLHITIGVMCLMDDVDRSKAVQLLNDCREMFVVPIKNEHKETKISVCGVDIMNDDPKYARYLFAKIKSDALQQIGDRILKRFIDAGLAKREFDRDSVKLHMTLINASSSSTNEDDDGNDGGGGNRGADNRNKIRKTFDARNMLDKYADYEFGQQTFNEIHLAIMKSNDTTNGFYKCTTSIQF